ncbi:MAG: hypothetical protein Q7K39_00725 [Candidatus Magasanikbacteria bacterium]|nr:hypothetical protein [Candidatus Magasanikbacteria bacterium]
MSFKNLLHWSYWINQPWPAEGLVFKVLVVIFLALVLGGFLALIFSQRQLPAPQKKLLQRLTSYGVYMGLAGLIWLGFRQEQVALLGSRFWMLIWAVVFVRWSQQILKYIIWRLPEVKKEQAAKAAKERYL